MNEFEQSLKDFCKNIFCITPEITKNGRGSYCAILGSYFDIKISAWKEAWNDKNYLAVALEYESESVFDKHNPDYDKVSTEKKDAWERKVDPSQQANPYIQGPKNDADGVDSHCYIAFYFLDGDENAMWSALNLFFSHSEVVKQVSESNAYISLYIKQKLMHMGEDCPFAYIAESTEEYGKCFIQFRPRGKSNLWNSRQFHYELLKSGSEISVDLHCEDVSLSRLISSIEKSPDLRFVKWGDGKKNVYCSKRKGNNSYSYLADRAVDDLLKFFREKGNLIDNVIALCEEKMANEELKEKYKDDIAFLENNHNIILHGAPGTGKTFMAKEIAKAMNAEYKVVQFHQSYDYTDFVEGLRPSGVGSKADFFERQDGVFKIFCKRALNSSKNGNFEESLEKLLKKIDECGTDYLEIPSQSSSFFVNFLNGKTIRFAPKITWEKNPEEFPYTINIDLMKNMYFGMVERFTNYSYARTLLTYMKDNFGLKDPNQKQAEKYVFIIDEINRGEMSKIFGELFLALEPSYRGENGRVDTQYQNLIENNDVFANGFYVPKNVYIIGTMNDIDRSVESMDFAMRRRFAFKEVTAEESMSMLDSEGAWKGNDESGVMPPSSVLVDLKARMAALNKEIAKPEYNLSKAYKIGAAYFLKFGLYFKQSTKEVDEAKAEEAFENLRKYHLEGLLREYLRGMDPKDDLLDKLLGVYNTTVKVDQKNDSENKENPTENDEVKVDE